MKLEKSLIDRIVSLRSEGTAEKQLSASQLALIYRENWFNLWVPKDLGGLASPFSTGLKFLRELAYWDGGLAWTVTLCAGANMFAGFLPPTTARDIWKETKVCLGGSGQINGRARVVENGFEISGTWQYATGAPHLTHFTLNAWVDDRDDSLGTEHRNERYFSFLVPREHVRTHSDWNTFGLECTASHSFSLDHVFVPAAYRFELTRAGVKVSESLYAISFISFAELTLFVNYLGMYQRFLDILAAQLSEKIGRSESDDLRVQEQIDRLAAYSAENQLELDWGVAAADRLEESGQELKRQDREELEAEVSQRTRVFIALMRSRLAEIMPWGGIKAAQYEEELNQVFRNIFTATQHALLNR